MSDRPIATTPLVLARLLKEFAIKLGMDSSFADAVAVSHIGSSTIVPVWNRFLTTNCSRCPHSPETCIYLRPKEKHCSTGASPSSLRAANIYMLETERVQKCPVLSSIRTLPASSTAGGGTDTNDKPTNDPPEDRGLSGQPH